MPLVPTASLPDDSRLWIFTSDVDLGPESATRLRTLLAPFLARWTAHKLELSVGFEILYDRFIIIAVDESYRAPSGCSIDSLVNGMKQIGAELGIPLVDTRDVTWRSGDGVHGTDRTGFAELVRQGVITLDTIVFDRTIQSIGEFRNGSWEKRAGQSWHARAFDFPSSKPGSTGI